MKKIFSAFLAIFLATFLVSFTQAGETKTTCDALNDKSCVVLFNDGTTVHATGYLVTITGN